MGPLRRISSSAVAVVTLLVGCNLHSGSGLNPDEYIEGGEGDGGENNQSDGGNTGSSSGTSGGGSGGSSGGSGGSSGGETPDAGEPESDATFDTGNPGPDTGTPPMDSGPACGTNTNCPQCCATSDPQGASEFIQDAQSCVCAEGTGPCASACASEFCANGSFNPGDPCDACLQQQLQPTSECSPKVTSECEGQASCPQFFSCFSACPGQ
jgi:hypothetical protein